MIAANDIYNAPADVWARLAAPLASETISWRQDGKPINRDGKFLARFVAYVEANTVRDRLDTVVPGEWDLTLTPLPPIGGEPAGEATCSFKARLQVLGVVREDVGTGRDYKQAATDAFKRAAVRFGIAHELYAYGQNWVELDGDGRYAKPVEDPAVVHARKESTVEPKVETARALDEETCPKCGGRMWDNRLTKRNPRAPDFKCRDRSCDGVIWPKAPEPAALVEAVEIPF
ncbi:MAG TPA: Rad52/Rad22 family DNA repair protein [Gemmatimonadaceae bacterium]|nr:Rad52/Rad22 family DNA repair protein [Gemmatimonadaceae bacterium]